LRSSTYRLAPGGSFTVIVARSGGPDESAWPGVDPPVVPGAGPGFGLDTAVTVAVGAAGFPAGAAGGFAGPVPAGGFAALRSANSTLTDAPDRTVTFFVTLSVSPSRSYSTRNRYVNSCPAGNGGLAKRPPA